MRRALGAAALVLLAGVAFLILARDRGVEPVRDDRTDTPSRPGEPGRAEAPLAPLATDGRTVRLAIQCLPAGAPAEWKLLLRGPPGGHRTATGRGEDVVELAGLSDGRHLAELTAPGFVGALSKFDVGGGAPEPEPLTLTRLGRIEGTVVGAEDGAPIPGVDVATRLPGRSVGRHAALTARSTDGTRLARSRSARTDDTGRFELPDLPPGSDYTLTLTDADHPPRIEKGLLVRPAETTAVTIALPRGVRLTGRVFGHDGEPVAGRTVELRRLERHVLIVEATAETDASGRFRSPALAPNEPKLVQAQFVRAGIHQAVRAAVDAFAEGERDVGDLAPKPGTIELRLPASARAEASNVTVATGGAGDQAVLITAVPFDDHGVARVAGFPLGVDVDYSVAFDSPRLSCEGRARMAGVNVIVDLEPVERDRPPPTRTLVVEVEGPGARRVAVSDRAGAFVANAIDVGDDGRARFKLAEGAYRVWAFTPHACADRLVDLAAGTPPVRLRPDQPVREVRFRILRSGEPLPRATVTIRGFDVEGFSHRPWATADDRGDVVLTSLPAAVRSLVLAILDEAGSGRRVIYDIESSPAEVDLDRR